MWPADRAYWWPAGDSSLAARRAAVFTNCGGAQSGKPWPRFATPPSKAPEASTRRARSPNSLQTVGAVPPPGRRRSADDRRANAGGGAVSVSATSGSIVAAFSFVSGVLGVGASAAPRWQASAASTATRSAMVVE